MGTPRHENIDTQLPTRLIHEAGLGFTWQGKGAVIALNNADDVAIPFRGFALKRFDYDPSSAGYLASVVRLIPELAPESLIDYVYYPDSGNTSVYEYRQPKDIPDVAAYFRGEPPIWQAVIGDKGRETILAIAAAIHSEQDNPDKQIGFVAPIDLSDVGTGPFYPSIPRF